MVCIKGSTRARGGLKVLSWLRKLPGLRASRCPRGWEEYEEGGEHRRVWFEDHAGPFTLVVGRGSDTGRARPTWHVCESCGKSVKKDRSSREVRRRRAQESFEALVERMQARGSDEKLA